jgi:molybdopterin adenylyltransferase
MEPGRQGRIVAVCASARVHVAKDEVPAARVVENHGLEGDAHAGTWHRQVSFIDMAQVDIVRRRIPGIRHGAFGENFVVEGIDLGAAGPGTRLRLGSEVLVEVSQIGKICHDRCAIYNTVGDCPMSSEGVFGRVLRGGEVKRGDPALVERLVGRQVPQCAVVVASDRCSRGETDDTAGEILMTMLEGSGFHALEKVVVPDDREAIKGALVRLCDERGVDVVLTCGGTGMTPRDVTPEATREMIDREVPGFSEAIRMVPFAKVPRAILSRGLSGLRGRTLIINLPGSEKGARESLEVVLPALGHAVEMLRGSVRDCGR